MIGLLTLLHYAIWLYMMIVIVRALLSWVNPDPRNPVVMFLRANTDPVLYFIRRNIPLPRTAVDLSPIILLIGLMLIDTFIELTLQNLRLRPAGECRPQSAVCSRDCSPVIVADIYVHHHNTSDNFLGKPGPV